jgi:acyl carrier protein
MATTAPITSDAVLERLTKAIIDLGTEPDDVTIDARLDELDIDSLDLIELRQLLSEDFGVVITREDLPAFENVRDIVDLVMARRAAP